MQRHLELLEQPAELGQRGIVAAGLAIGVQPLAVAAPPQRDLLGVAGITVTYVGLRAGNPTTVALSYLLGIVLIATWWGIGPSTVAAVAATLTFNFFFLPPVGTLTIAEAFPTMSFVRIRVDAQLPLRSRSRVVYERMTAGDGRPTGELYTDDYAVTLKQLIEVTGGDNVSQPRLTV